MKVKASLVLTFFLLIFSIAGLNAQSSKTYQVSGFATDNGESCIFCYPFTLPNTATVKLIGPNHMISSTVFVNTANGGEYTFTHISFNELTHAEITYHSKTETVYFTKITPTIYVATLNVRCQHKVIHKDVS